MAAVLIEEQKDGYDDIPLAVRDPVQYGNKSDIQYSQHDADYKIKVMLFGESEVGKTSMILRFTADIFDPNHNKTIGIDTQERIVSVDGKIVFYRVVDTAGHNGGITPHAKLFKSVISSV